MTQKENQQLLDLLRKKEAEIKMAIEYVDDKCYDDRLLAECETQDLRKMRRHTQGLINEMTADFGAQETIDHVNDDLRELGLDTLEDHQPGVKPDTGDGTTETWRVDIIDFVDPYINTQTAEKSSTSEVSPQPSRRQELPAT